MLPPPSPPGPALRVRLSGLLVLAAPAAAAVPRGSGRAAAGVWWSFRPLRAPAMPDVRDPNAEIGNPVDAFVRAQRQAAGLPPADRRTLIRRVTFDLIGLPPTPEEIDAFVHDPA